MAGPRRWPGLLILLCFAQRSLEDQIVLQRENVSARLADVQIIPLVPSGPTIAATRNLWQSSSFVLQIRKASKIEILNLCMWVDGEFTGCRSNQFPVETTPDTILSSGRHELRIQLEFRDHSVPADSPTISRVEAIHDIRTASSSSLNVLFSIPVLSGVKQHLMDFHNHSDPKVEALRHCVKFGDVEELNRDHGGQVTILSLPSQSDFV